MTSTTIKVSDVVRDRLKVQAARAHRTLGEHLAHLADIADREDRMASLRAAMAATPADQLASYRAEVAAWERMDR